MVTCPDVLLRPEARYNDTSVYELHVPQFSPRFFLISDPSAQPLLAFPETVGFDAYKALVAPTASALNFLKDRGLGDNMDILTILRGGLNYPLEEAAAMSGIRTSDIHFISCERDIVDHVIKGLAIKYDKIRPKRDMVLAIGDILATGDTFGRCLDFAIDTIQKGGGSIRRFIFFTIGGTRALRLMQRTAERMKSLWPGFEGIDCFFYEGMFTVYTDHGASGINVPDIDFGWQGGVVTPEFRSFVMDHPDALYEKCIIYDGGARRYEIPVHFDEVLEYWEGILRRSEIIDPVALTAEKLGYPTPLPFGEWKSATGFAELEQNGLRELWERETALLKSAGELSLRDLALRRIQSVKSIQTLYD